MTADYDQGFFSLQQLLHEEGLGSPPHQQASASWAEMLVTREGGNLTDTQRRFIVDKLLVMRENEKLPRGSQSKIAVEVGVHRSTISRIFKKAEEQRLRGENIDVRSLIPKNCGAKPLECTEEWLQSAPLHLRCNYRAYAGALKCSHMRIQRLLKKGLIRAHTSNNHPSVTDPHKIARMKWCLSHIIPGTQNLNATFVDMRNVIHIDEKWFYLNPDMRRFYLLPKEIDPYRTCQSRRYKIKAMFMGVNGRPLYGENGQMIHDGKYGMFPFIFKQRAKKSSKNRVAGTMETKAIQNVTKQVIRDMIINKVIPSIMDKWPANMPKNIIVQQDNARPHLQPNDTDFKACATQNGYNIQLIFQPPQSPDLNVLDLGLFRSVQSLQYQSFPKNLDDLIEKVEAAYNRFDPNLINYTWLQLQYVMVEILKVRGGNNYKNPHHGKARMERLGILPQNVEFPQRVVDEAVHYLNELCNDNVDDMQFFEDGMEVDADYM